MTKAIGDFPTLPPQNLDCRNNADAIAEVPRILSSNALVNSVHTTGNSDLGDGQRAPITMISPSNGYGHDHSGGVWGRPFRRSVCTMSFDNSDLYSPNFLGGGYRSAINFNSVSPDTTVDGGCGEFKLYVPPCDPLNGAYNLLGVQAGISGRFQTNVFSADTVTLEIKNTTTGDSVTLDALDGYSSSSTTYFTHSNSDSQRLNMAQGALNSIQLKAYFHADAGGGLTRTIQVRISEISFFVF